MMFLLCQSVLDLSGGWGFNPLQLPLGPLSPQVFIDPSPQLFAVISCSFLDRVTPASLFIFQQHRYLCETYFQACWLSNLNIEVVDSLQKMICVKLLRRLLQIFLIWQKISPAFPLTLLGICNSNNFLFLYLIRMMLSYDALNCTMYIVQYTLKM